MPIKQAAGGYSHIKWEAEGYWKSLTAKQSKAESDRRLEILEEFPGTIQHHNLIKKVIIILKNHLLANQASFQWKCNLPDISMRADWSVLPKYAPQMAPILILSKIRELYNFYVLFGNRFKNLEGAIQAIAFNPLLRVGIQFKHPTQRAAWPHH